MHAPLKNKLAFAVTPRVDFEPISQAIIQEHYDEVAKYKNVQILNPAFEKYRELDREGNLQIVTAWDGGELVGYFIWAFYLDKHYQILYALEDVHFLRRSHRVGWSGYFFIKYATECAKNKGAEHITMREKVAIPHGPVLERIGYELTDRVYTMAKGHGRWATAHPHS
jgi:hypothetical protein